MTRIEDISPPDITGLESAIIDFLIGCAEVHQPRSQEILGKFLEFAQDYRELDSWVRTAKRCKQFQPREPVLYKNEVGIVQSVTANRVACRLWPNRLGVSTSGDSYRIARVDPVHLRKVSDDRSFSVWVEGMVKAGFSRKEMEGFFI